MPVILDENQSSKENSEMRWDLKDLYADLNDPKIETDLSSLLERAYDLSKTHKGRISSIDDYVILEVVDSLEAIHEDTARIEAFSQLLYAADTQAHSIRRFYQKILEKGGAIRNQLLFFHIEWCELSNFKVKALLKKPSFKGRKHYLENIRKYAPYNLSEKEEALLEISNNTGRRAFLRLFDETLAAMRFVAPPGFETLDINEEEILSLTHHANRVIRKSAALNFTSGLKDKSELLTFIFNTLISEKGERDRLRSHKHSIDRRNLDNEISGDSVEALMNACELRYDLVQRYYRLKSKILKIDQLSDYDRYAPINQKEQRFEFGHAKELVLSAYSEFSSEMASIGEMFFSNNWIDAEVRGGKRGGAFSASTVPSVHPYILMSFSGNIRDVMTLAHELGHGIHQYLSRENGYFEQDAPLTTAETASVFGEMIVFRKMIKGEIDAKTRLSLICGKLEDCFATVFRQVMMTRFEQCVHNERNTQGELTTKQINEMWINQNRNMFGDSVSLGKHYEYWWMYIPHFFHSPFYCYAYAFGELLVFSLLRKYEEEWSPFVPEYLDLLRSGGSKSPDDLLSRMNMNISDAKFWSNGLILIENLLNDAEALSLEINN